MFQGDGDVYSTGNNTPCASHVGKKKKRCCLCGFLGEGKSKSEVCEDSQKKVMNKPLKFGLIRAS